MKDSMKNLMIALERFTQFADVYEKYSEDLVAKIDEFDNELRDLISKRNREIAKIEPKIIGNENVDVYMDMINVYRAEIDNETKRLVNKYGRTALKVMSEFY